MAFRDSWHRALVYFGLAEDATTYDDDEPARQRARGGARGALPRAPERAAAELAPPPARRVRRHLRRRRARRARRRRVAAARSAAAAAGNGRSGDVRVHLVVPKSFNDAQQVADKFKDSIPVILNLQGSTPTCPSA